MVFLVTAPDLRVAIRFPAMDFFEGLNLCREDCFRAGLLPVVPLGGCLLAMAGIVLGVCCPTATPDSEERVFVLNFLVFCPGATVLICCLADRVGFCFFGACSTVVGGILALKIFDFCSGALLIGCFAAGDPAGNIIEVTNCRR